MKSSLFLLVASVATVCISMAVLLFVILLPKPRQTLAPIPPRPPPVATPTYTNPVLRTSSADPGVCFHEGTYYLYATDRYAFKSTDLVNWTPIDAGRVFGSLGGGLLWDPVVNRRHDGFYLNYTLDAKLYNARGDSPEGPFYPHAGPFVDRWCVGGDYFNDDDGTEYLVWNTGGCEADTGPWIGKLVDNATRVDETQHLVNAAMVGPWAYECVVEGPFMLKHKGTYYLTFTANSTGPNYAFGYATGPTVRGPWTMYAGNPLFKTTGNFVGPGHVGFLSSARGTVAVFHSSYKGWPDGRYACVAEVEWLPDPSGGPDILHVPAPSDDPLPFPLSGTERDMHTKTR